MSDDEHKAQDSSDDEPSSAPAQTQGVTRISNNAALDYLNEKFGDPVLVIRNLTKSYVLEDREEPVHALKGINIHDESACPAIRRGEFVMIRGPSGGGKTTLLNLIGSLDQATSGSISLFGKAIDADSKDSYLADLRLERIGFVFQTFNLLATLSAFENVLLPMTIAGKLSDEAAKKRAIELLEAVGLGDRLEHLPSECSGGEQQRITIARAMANDPELLVVDEGTGDLDTRTTLSIMSIFRGLNTGSLTPNASRKTIIFVTHNDDLECYASRVLYMLDGKIQRMVLQQPRELSTAYLHHVEAEHL